MCRRHYRRALDSGELKKLPRPTLEQRLLSKTDRSGNCWVWLGSKLKSGYGQIGVQGATPDLYRPRMVHRVSYEIFVGPIPDGLEIDHLCRNTSCLNPDHLEAVTPAVNMGRGMSPNHVIRRSGYCSAGHEMTPENTYLNKNGIWRRCRECTLEGNRRRRKRYSAA